MRFLALACAILSAVPLTAATLPTSSPVVVVALENESYSDVVGSASMPYYNSLISKYALTGNFYADVHGSFPDYAMVTSGELITAAGWGLPSDFPISIDNIVREMVKTGKTWKVYAENLPAVGYTGGDQWPYVKRHNPFAYMTDVVGTAQANNLVPFHPNWSSAVSSNTLPNFSFVIPNIVDDGNECPDGTTNCPNATRLSNVDQWLQVNIAPLFQNPAFRSGGVLILWWDEGDAADTANGGGRLANLFAGPKVKTNYVSKTFYRHEHVLRTVEELLGINKVGCTIYIYSMSDLFLGF
jgi:phosphatidylinositol-3-phosphatase